MSEKGENQEITKETTGTLDPTAFEEDADPAEALWEGKVSDEALRDIERRSTLPALTYTTIAGETKLKRAVYKDDKTGATRRIANFWSKITAFDPKTQEEVVGFVGYKLSDQFQNRFDFDTGEDTGKPDRASINFVQAKKAFVTASGGEIDPSNEEVLQYLVQYSHRLRVVPFNGSPFVVAISPIVDKG